MQQDLFIALPVEPPTPSEQCAWCSNDATLLCDALLGCNAQLYEEGDTPRLVRSVDAGMHTCDMPLCRDHATHGGNIHFCKEGQPCDVDSIDHCPHHTRNPGSGEFLTDAGAVRARRDIRRVATLTGGVIEGGA